MFDCIVIEGESFPFQLNVFLQPKMKEILQYNSKAVEKQIEYFLFSLHFPIILQHFYK